MAITVSGTANTIDFLFDSSLPMFLWRGTKVLIRNLITMEISRHVLAAIQMAVQLRQISDGSCKKTIRDVVDGVGKTGNAPQQALPAVAPIPIGQLITKWA